MPITTSQSKSQRPFAPKNPTGFLRKTDRHQIVIGIVGNATAPRSPGPMQRSIRQRERPCG